MSTNGNAKKRLYVVHAIGPDSKLVNPKRRLIRATSQAAALKFALDGIYDVEVADAEDAAALVGEGTKIEEAVS